MYMPRAAALIIVAIAALRAVAGGTVLPNQDAGRKDVPVVGVRVGFALTMAKRNGSTFTCVDTVTHHQMESFSVTTNGSVVTVVWKGYPKCGERFQVTARFTLLPNGGFEYSGFDWAGNESPFYVHRVSFPEVAVPRTERTAVFRPHAMGEVFRPNWRKHKPCQTASATVADYLAFNCIATMDDGAGSHFLDMRGEARRVSPTAFYVRNGEHRGDAGGDAQDWFDAVHGRVCAVSRRVVRGRDNAPRVDGDATLVQGRRRARLLEVARDRHLDVGTRRRRRGGGAGEVVHEGDRAQGRP